jgi:excisionase family DNA binding protein
VSEYQRMMLKIREAADELGVSESFFYGLMRSGQIRSLKLGPNATRIPRTELDAYNKRKQAEQWSGPERKAAEPGDAA